MCDAGAIGLFSEPVRGLEEDGVLGLLRGVRRGALGFVVLPLVALLEMSARAADSVRRAVAGSSNVGWVRPPRWVGPSPTVKYTYQPVACWIRCIAHGALALTRVRWMCRYINAGQPLRAYAWSEAMGRWLLAEVARFEASHQVRWLGRAQRAVCDVCRHHPEGLLHCCHL